MVYIAQYDENNKVIGFKDENKSFYPLDYKKNLEALVAIKKATIIYKTVAELEAIALEVVIPAVVSMGQARAALIQSNKFNLVNDAILASGDAMLISDWEYRTEVKRDWSALITLTDSLNITSTELDDLFLSASTL